MEKKYTPEVQSTPRLFLPSHKKEYFPVCAQTGKYSFLWDGKNNLGVDCTSGVYFFSITSGDFYQSKKIVYLK